MRLVQFLTLFGCLLLPASSCALAQEKPVSSELPTHTPFKYPKADFGNVKVEDYKKQKVEDPNEPTMPFDAPAHRCYHLEVKRPLPALEKGPRYFYPASSFLCLVPTSDPSEAHFSAAYPNYSKAVELIKKLLKERPMEFRQFDDLFDFPYNNAGWSVKAKVSYLDFADVSGVFFLTQYSNELTPNPLNNEELTANFQGITKDGRYYVAARFSITHPDLPRGIDFVDSKLQYDCLESKYPEINTCVSRYLKAEQTRLEALPESSFVPSLGTIRSLLSSVSTR